MEIDNKKENFAFILAWTASIWKRVWRCAYLYCDHQKKEITAEIILKCLKYNILCPTGIASQIIPSLNKALEQGFLMPKDYENNEYVKRAISLFGDAYKISQIEEIHEQNKEIVSLISTFVSTIALDKENIKKKEINDILALPNYKVNNFGKHKCTFCDLIEAWDINLSLYTPSSKLHSILFYYLLKVAVS